MSFSVKPLEWSEERSPSESCRYDHIEAETPIGRFQITWKGWKEYPSYDCDESPWGYLCSGSNLEQVKAEVEEIYRDKILSCCE